jgi:photosystem II stability/assembly factor-like uncharacterized protein
MINLIKIATLVCLSLLVAMGHGQWVPTGGPLGLVTRALTVCGGVLLAGTDNGVFVSTNNGNTWSLSNAGLAKDTVVSLVVSGYTLFAGTLHSGIYTSTNNGNSWTAANKGLPTDPIDSKIYSQVNDITAAGGNLYACVFHRGVFLSQNSGRSWTSINFGLTNTDVQSLAMNGIDLYAGTGTGGGVFVSSDSGAAWKEVNNGLTYTPGMVYSVNSLAASNGRLFAGTLVGGVYKTVDNGENWTSANNGLSATIVHSLYAHDGGLFAGTGNSGVFLTKDNGRSWIGISNGLPVNTAVLCLCMRDSTLFAGIYGSGVWRLSVSNTLQAPTGTAFNQSAQEKVLSMHGNSGTLRYTLPVASNVSINYYGLEGKLLASFVGHNQGAGNYSPAKPILPHGFYIRDFRAGSVTQKDLVRILR